MRVLQGGCHVIGIGPTAQLIHLLCQNCKRVLHIPPGGPTEGKQGCPSPLVYVLLGQLPLNIGFPRKVLEALASACSLSGPWFPHM